MKKSYFLYLILLILPTLFVFGQEDKTQPKRFDYGKMWTFENPPKSWFKEAYNFTPEDKWYDDVRKSSLRFASWCSASFVSPNGLIMTNLHCSREEALKLQKTGEDIQKDGFYASTLAEERKANGLYVEQLIQVIDISERVLKMMDKGSDDASRNVFRDSALAEINREYSSKPEWTNLRLQTVSFYSGGKFSLYGYKRYNDIRLVLIPEAQVGEFGGDPDNFTYPRYDLDCTFWRAYDENGNPVNSSANYFKFNQVGAAEGEPVFVIGNPGRTERYRTYSQLEYDRDIRYPGINTVNKHRMDLMLKEYEKNPTPELHNKILRISNSLKAQTGIYNGLMDANLMARKKNSENEVRAKTKLKGEDPWTEMTKLYEVLRKYGSSIDVAGPSEIKGNAVMLMATLNEYEKELMKGSNSPQLEKLKEQIKKYSKDLNSTSEKELLALYLGEIKQFEHPMNKYIDKVLDGKSAEARAEKILSKTDFVDAKEVDEILDKKYEKFKKEDDPLLEAARIIMPKVDEAVGQFQSTGQRRMALGAKIANYVFKVRGTDLPPDATFTLRISDGVVKGYNYNGTTAPYKTTFFGMYDRNYSFDKKFPFNLPARWENPPLELLKSPYNFTSTNDIIGGNSGSPVVNKNKEIVGLAFDGNIESLPGNFIYDDVANRTVSVHSSGMLAAVKYIYRADRLYSELIGK